MNAPMPAELLTQHHLAESVAQACARIAPSFPLDRFIAANPYLGFTHHPWDEAAARLHLLAGLRMTLPRAHFRERWQAQVLRPQHLEAALARHGHPMAPAQLAAALQQDEAPAHALPLLATLRDASPLPGDPPQGWRALLAHQISQHCAAFFDDGQARWRLEAKDEGLWPSWRRMLAADRGLPWRLGRRAMAQRVQALPEAPLQAVGHVLQALGLPEEAWPDYLAALLLSLPGWAGWCAGRRWESRLAGGDDGTLEELLAVRAAWELLLHEDAPAGAIPPHWTRRWERLDGQVAQQAAALQVDLLLHEALEIAYQQPLAQRLAATAGTAAAGEPACAPLVQAVFCIDVRSEPLRRALEAASPWMATRGFAGFFGLPLAWQPLGGTLQRAQLPALLAPALQADDAGARDAALGQVLARRRRQALHWRQRWAALRGTGSSGFSFVEALGLGYGAKLLGDSFAAAPPTRWEHEALPEAARALRPRLAVADTDPQAAAALAHGVLTAMGLTQGFAPLVLLVGHGASCANNPHAASLDCGACGGHSGEVNARALADLLNDASVRAALAGRGVALGDTHFLPALHDTTTDAVTLYDEAQVPPALHQALALLRRALEQASATARVQRAPALGLDGAQASDPEALAGALRRRAADWSQVRPEWGLAGNAAFVAAPRARTRGLDLGGRVFLHDYDAAQDVDGRVLTLVMTAPAVVASWINLHYHACCVEPQRWGGGDKVLHNVVGGHLGVFEGNGGDLRTGLPWQSLHDGRRWRHEPLRLSVFVQAPREAIDTVLAAHEGVRDLVRHGWIHLLRLDADAPVAERWTAQGWEAVG